MAWHVEFGEKAEKTFKKLDVHLQEMITKYLTENVITSSHPKKLGKALTGNLKKLWRYRIGKFRIICEIRDHELIVLVLKIGHRSDIY